MVAFSLHAQRNCTRDRNAEVVRTQPTGPYRHVHCLNDHLMLVAELGLGKIWVQSTKGRYREKVCILRLIFNFHLPMINLYCILVRLTYSDTLL